MNRDDLINALGQVDDDLYEAADALRQQPLKKKNNRTWVRWAAMAACLCVVGAGAVLFMNRGGRSSATTMAVSESTMESAASVSADEASPESAETTEEASEDMAPAEGAIAPQANDTADEADGATDSVSAFAMSGSSASASSANATTSLTVEIITADRDEVLTFTDADQSEAVLTWLSEADALTADEFAAQYGSLTDHAKWPAAVTIITVASDDGSTEPEVWYVPAELPQILTGSAGS